MKTLLASATLALIAGASLAQDNPMVGGAEMPATNDIVTNALNSADHTTLVAAVQAAGDIPLADGIHPNDVGYEAMVREERPFVLKALHRR